MSNSADFTLIKDSAFGKFLNNLKDKLEELNKTCNEKKTQEFFKLIKEISDQVEKNILPYLENGNKPGIQKKVKLYNAMLSIENKVQRFFNITKESGQNHSDELFISALLNSFLAIFKQLEVTDPLTYELFETVSNKLEDIPNELHVAASFLNPKALETNLLNFPTKQIANKLGIRPFSLTQSANDTNNPFLYDLKINKEETVYDLNQLFQVKKSKIKELLEQKIEDYKNILPTLNEEIDVNQKRVNDFATECTPLLEWSIEPEHDNETLLTAYNQKTHELKNLLEKTIELSQPSVISKLPERIVIKENGQLLEKHTHKQFNQKLNEQTRQLTQLKERLQDKLQEVSVKQKKLTTQSLSVETLKENKNTINEKLKALQKTNTIYDDLKSRINGLNEHIKKLTKDKDEVLFEVLFIVKKAKNEWQQYKNLCSNTDFSEPDKLFSTHNLSSFDGIKNAQEEINNRQKKLNFFKIQEKKACLENIQRHLKTLKTDDMLRDIHDAIDKNNILLYEYTTRLNEIKAKNSQKPHLHDNPTSQVCSLEKTLALHERIIPIIEDFKSLYNESILPLETLHPQLTENIALPSINDLKSGIEEINGLFDENRKKIMRLAQSINNPSHDDSLSEITESINKLKRAAITCEQNVKDLKIEITIQCEVINRLPFENKSPKALDEINKQLEKTNTLYNCIAGETQNEFAALKNNLLHHLNDLKVHQCKIKNHLSQCIAISDEYIPLLKHQGLKQDYIDEIKQKLEKGENENLIADIKKIKMTHAHSPLQPLFNRLIIKLWQLDSKKRQTNELILLDPRIYETIRKDNLKFARGIDALFEKINQLSAFGETLDKKQQETVQTLAASLRNNVFSFLSACNHKTPSKGAFEAFKADFNCLLHSQDDVMSQHESNWRQFKFICANILAAVTTLGIAVGVKLAVSKAVTGRAAFFYAQSARLEQLAKIEKEVDGLDKSLDEQEASSQPPL